MIQSENTFLVGYVIFDKLSGRAEVDVVKEASNLLEAKVKSGELVLPKGVSYKFAGNYEQQQRATDRLMIVLEADDGRDEGQRSGGRDGSERDR